MATLQPSTEKLTLAMRLLAQKDYATSEKLFTELVTLGLELPECFYGLGLLRLASNQPDAATQHFEACIRLQPNHSNAYYYLGEILERQQDMEGAKRYFSKSLEHNPTHAGARKKLPLVVPVQGADSSLPAGEDLYALLRHSTEPVEREIALRLDRIAQVIGSRRARLRAFLGLWHCVAVGICAVILMTGNPMKLLGYEALGYWRAYLHLDAWTNSRDTVPFNFIALVLQPLCPFALLSLLLSVPARYLRARSSRISCERDWLIVSEGVFRRVKVNYHLLLLSRNGATSYQTMLNRMTRDGVLVLGDVKLRGFFSESEIDKLASDFRELSVLNPTSRKVLAALGDLKNIRSGA